MADSKTILAFMAHPDDVEILCAGTLVRLQREHGARIAIATSTSGDKGSIEHGPAEIARIRNGEGKKAAALIDAEFHCLGSNDLMVMYDPPTLAGAVEIVRRVQPDVVITHFPDDYMVDHEITSKLVRTACFAGGVPNFLTGAIAPAPLCSAIPHLYYADPIEGKDLLGRRIEPAQIIDISSTIDMKEKMLACHASQREWLRAHHGMDQYIISMKQWSALRGKEIGAEYGEGFRQHLGHAYPQDNLLGELLGP
jgi:LmbE family N-acetylglucosaminyl deacetylase